jgi:hypothetical protein
MITIADTFCFDADSRCDALWADFHVEMERILNRIQEQYGPGENGRTLVVVKASEFPVTYVQTVSTIEVHIQPWKENDRAQACLQLSHELVHVLSQMPAGTPTRLEEGLATHFSECYVSEKYRATYDSSRSYAEAKDDTRKLLALNPQVIGEIRTVQPVISLISADDIMRACPTCPPELAARLAKPS